MHIFARNVETGFEFVKFYYTTLTFELAATFQISEKPIKEMGEKDNL